MRLLLSIIFLVVVTYGIGLLNVFGAYKHGTWYGIGNLFLSGVVLFSALGFAIYSFVEET